MAGKTTITAPHDSRQGEVPIGAEVTAGETTGKLKVFDTGVDGFPNLTGAGGGLVQGFHALTIDKDLGAQSLDVAYMNSSSNPVVVPIKAKRSITLLASSNNPQSVFVGDSATSASTTGSTDLEKDGNSIGFPLAAGAALTLEITLGSQIFLDCHTADCVVFWIAV
jgi:hypothetical protein